MEIWPARTRNVPCLGVVSCATSKSCWDAKLGVAGVDWLDENAGAVTSRVSLGRRPGISEGLRTWVAGTKVAGAGLGAGAGAAPTPGQASETVSG